MRKDMTVLHFVIWLICIKMKYKWTLSFLIHFSSTIHGHICINRVPTHTHEKARTHLLSSRAWTITHKGEGCEERCGILLGLIYQRLGEVLSGHSSAADSGPGLGPLGDRQTPSRSWGSGIVHHTHTAKHTFAHTRLCFHTLVFHFLIKEKRLLVKDMPPSGASCSTCRCMYLCFLLFFLFLDLASVALLLEHVHAVSPSMTRASHRARWTSHPANLHTLHKSWSCHRFEKQVAFPPRTLHKNIPVMLWIFMNPSLLVKVNISIPISSQAKTYLYTNKPQHKNYQVYIVLTYAIPRKFWTINVWTPQDL